MAEAYQVKITANALSELHAIFEFIRQDSPQNAAGMIEKILTAIDALELMPRRFKVVGRSRKRNSPIHSRVVRPFIVYYRVDDATRTVFVVEIRHGARRQPRTFG